MIYYSILNQKNEAMIVVDEEELEHILSVVDDKYKEVITIHKIDIDRYKKINSKYVIDTITNEKIMCYGEISATKGCDKLNRLSRKRERENAKVRAMNL